MALVNREGQQAEALLARSQQEGVAVLHDLTAAAVGRLLARSRPRAVRSLFNAQERQALAEALAATTGTAELLGRSRILRRRQLSEARRGRTHAEEDQPFAAFDEQQGLAPLEPGAAVRYFQGLAPQLGTDPERFGADQRRRAFTLAVATEEVLLERVQAVLAESLQQGRSTAEGTRLVQELLNRAGISPRNPQYAAMVFRTNLMDAYNQGAQEQLAESRDFFPVWRYVGIRDGRQGKDHEPHFDRYYPATAPFTVVRGPRAYNCRCSLAPISIFEWEELQARGVTLAPGYRLAA